MKVVEAFERTIGGRWTGIVFYKDMPRSEGNGSGKKHIRFCEAVKNSYTRPIVLTQDLLNCPGGRWSLGWENHPELLIHRLTNDNGLSAEMVSKLMANAPHLDRELAAVTIGGEQTPDVIVSFAQAGDAMKLVRRWQQKTGSDLDVPISSLMSVCGSVVRAYLTQRIGISFGCPESRKYGNISRDRLVIGVPYQTAEKLM